MSEQVRVSLYEDCVQVVFTSNPDNESHVHQHCSFLLSISAAVKLSEQLSAAFCEAVELHATLKREVSS